MPPTPRKDRAARDQALIEAYWQERQAVAPPPEPEVGREQLCGDRRETWVCNRPAGHLTDDSPMVDNPRSHRHRHTSPGGVRVTAEWFDDEPR